MTTWTSLDIYPVPWDMSGHGIDRHIMKIIRRSALNFTSHHVAKHLNVKYVILQIQFHTMLLEAVAIVERPAIEQLHSTYSQAKASDCVQKKFTFLLSKLSAFVQVQTCLLCFYSIELCKCFSEIRAPNHGEKKIFLYYVSYSFFRINCTKCE